MKLAVRRQLQITDTSEELKQLLSSDPQPLALMIHQEVNDSQVCSIQQNINITIKHNNRNKNLSNITETFLHSCSGFTLIQH